MLDFISEIGSSFPWFYRGWLYLLSPTYRYEMQQVWQRSSHLFVIFDVALTISVFAGESVLVAFLGLWLLK
jgi:hypothetical protein